LLNQANNFAKRVLSEEVANDVTSYWTRKG
jgi:hypothetical protein